MSSKNLSISHRADVSKEWCVYVITYSGDKLPPFYVGYVRSKRILDEGYHGTVTSKDYKPAWESELKENPHLFRRKILRSFETKKEANGFEMEVLKHFGAKKSSLFVNMANGFPPGITGPIPWEVRVKNSRANKLAYYRRVNCC